MADNQKSVFDRLDSIEASNEKIIDLLKELKSSSPSESNNRDSSPDEQSIKEEQFQNINSTKNGKNSLEKEKTFLQLFIKSSKKEHVWFGSDYEFKKAKMILRLLIICLIIFGIISTICTSISLNFYSTFTLFENIWLAFSCVLLSYSIHLKKRMLDVDLKMNSNDIFTQNMDGTWIDTNNEKKRFKWFRRISYISCLANIIILLCFSKGGITVSSVIFEVIYLGLSIGIYFALNNLYAMYGAFILFTNKNLSNTQNVTLVFDVYGKKLAPYEEYKEKMKNYI